MFPHHQHLRRATHFALLAAISLVTLGLFAPCARADEPAFTPQALAYFETNVRPLLVARCYECHAGEESNGGLRVDARTFLLKGGDTGPAVQPGNADASLLVRAVSYTDPNLQMPPKSPLAPQEVETLKQWIAMGMPDPRAEPTAAAPSPTGMSIEEGRAFWSMKPVVDPPLPTISGPYPSSPVDVFLLHSMQAQHLAPAPPIDRAHLLRRASYDLTGLPPEPFERDAFLHDPRPDAWDRATDRFLSSPAYGIRWARHWLDVARYADSNGLDENLAFGTAWRYRDYVVDAFNADHPFDQFLVEQIAGDLIDGADQRTRTATGFLVLGAKVLAEPDREKLTMDTIDEQIDTVGKAFLGMTLGCVRCHDHKFDPIKQTDYYALAAIFKSTKTFGDTNFGAIKHWNEHSWATDADRESLKKIDERINQKKEAANAYKSKAMEAIKQAARAKAADYLSAAANLSFDATLSEVEQAAAPAQLHPRILAYCRRHLEFHRDDPLFVPWHERYAQKDSQGIREHYAQLFAEVDRALEAAQQQKPPATTLADARLEEARLALADPSGFLAVPPKVEFAFDSATLAEYHRLAEEARVLESAAPDEPSAMGVQDQTILTSLPIHIRGSHLNLGEPVERAFPQVMRDEGTNIPLPPNQSGRRELAQWLASPEHPLTARVFVNRVWRWHMGRGIVPSVDNFGKLGDAPTHPELLDWLASRFTEMGYSVKSLHRLLMTSDFYRSSSYHPQAEACEAVDPDNTLGWKFRARRLEAEEIRDSILYLAGRLDQSVGGKTVPLRNRQFVFDHTSIDHTRYDSTRRALYLPVIRNNIYPFFEQFDFPDPTMPTGSRHTTIVAPQALLLMNSDVVLDSARQLAADLWNPPGTDDDHIRQAYDRILGRLPSAREHQRAAAFISQATESAPLVRSLFVQSLLTCNEFLYVR